MNNTTIKRWIIAMVMVLVGLVMIIVFGGSIFFSASWPIDIGTIAIVLMVIVMGSVFALVKVGGSSLFEFLRKPEVIRKKIEEHPETMPLALRAEKMMEDIEKRLPEQLSAHQWEILPTPTTLPTGKHFYPRKAPVTFFTQFEFHAEARKKIPIGELKLYDTRIITPGDYGSSVAPFLHIMVQLPGRLDGWLRVTWKKGSHAGLREKRLESTDFNEKIYVYGEPAAMAFKVLSPDFMDWYVQEKVQPWILVEGSLCVVTYEADFPVDNIPAVEKQIEIIYNFVVKSGALEKA